MRRTTILFEIYSPLQVICAWWQIRQCHAVIFSRRTPFEPPSPLAKRLALAILRRLNPRAAVHELTVADLLEYLPLNREAVRVVESMAGELAGTVTYRRMRRLIGDDALVRYYQASIARTAANWALFPSAVRKRGVDGEAIGYADWDTAALAPRFGAITFASAGRHCGSLRRYMARWRARVESLAVVTVVTLRALRNGRLERPRGPYAVGLPVWWGITDAEAQSGMLRRPHADDQLYGDGLQAGDIVHLFGELPYAPDQERAFMQAMDRRGYAHADLRALRIGHDSWRIARAALRTALTLFLPHGGDPIEDAVLRETPKAFYHLLRKHLILDNIAYRAEVVRNDYNPGHVIASIVCRQRGVRTVGVQHNVLPFEGPQVAFLDVDELSIFGDFYRKGFEPSWDRLRLHHVGRESLDWTVSIVSQPHLLADARRRWRAFRGNDRPFAVVIFPDDREICIEPQWHEFYRGLQMFARTTTDLDVVFRFRNEQSVRAAYVNQFLTLPDADARFATVWKDFTTYELMAMSAVVISHDGSFSVNEALALGRPTFTFEFVMAGHHYFPPRYGRDFVISTASELARVLETVPSGFDRFDCDWTALGRDLNAHADGGNGARLRAIVARAAGLAVPVVPLRAVVSR